MFFVCMVVYLLVGLMIHSFFWMRVMDALVDLYKGKHQRLWTIVSAMCGVVALFILWSAMALWPITSLMYFAYRMGTTPKVSF